MRRFPWLKQGASAAGLLIYAIASHWALTQHWVWLAFALAVLPLLGLAVGYVHGRLLEKTVKTSNKTLLVLASVCASFTLLSYWAQFTPYTLWIFLIQSAGSNLLLAAVFGYSLLPGKTALITQFASIVHTDLPPFMQRYTRNATWAWVAFFVMMASVSMGLFFYAPLAVWSVFINLLSWPLLGGMFLAEYGVRIALYPDFERVSIAQGFQAFQTYYAAPASAPSNTQTETL